MLTPPVCGTSTTRWSPPRCAQPRQGDYSARQPVVAAEHQEEPDDEKIDARHHDRVFARIALDIVPKILGHLGPMAGRLQVVPNVVAVVEAATIVRSVDAGDAVSIAISGYVDVDEGVLPPVSRHHREAHHDERNEEDDERCLPIDAKQSGERGVPQQLAAKALPEQTLPALAVK